MGDKFCDSYEILDVDGRAVHDGIALSCSEQSNLVLQLPESSNSAESFEFDKGARFASLEQRSGLEQSSDLYNFAPFYNVTSPDDFLNDYGSYPVLRYINHILMEENVEEQQNVHHDSLALQAAEESFYEILGKNYPTPMNNEQSPDGSAGSAFQYGASGNATNSPANDPQSVLDADKLPGKEPQPLADHFMSSSQANSLQSLNISKHYSISGDGQIGCFSNEALVSSFFSNSEAILQFKKGLEEGNKFLPAGSQLGIDSKWELASKLEKVETVASRSKDEKKNSVRHSRGRKHQLQDDNESDLGRSSKQSAANGEEVELAEIFDALMLYADGQIQCSEANVGKPGSSSDIFCQNEFVHGSDVGKCSEARQNTDCEAPDISASLISCAQFVATGDQRAANEQLKLIRQHASRTGNPQQRLAVIFANALEARMTGTGADLYVALTARQNSAAVELKSHRIYLCAPFRQMISFFANTMILQAASKATTLHIVDFGISFGFQWPNLIQLLSQRAGGPPRLRITGIDYPQPGFRPAERIEQTGRRLAKYCERFNIPFQFQAIASKNWEKIEIDLLKLSRNEVLAVNCHYLFHGMPDETVDDECPRDAVFSLIRNMNPDILVTAILNAQLDAPYFLTRFREALIFYSMIFDLLDNNLPHNDQQRVKFEQECFGSEVMNFVACEGTARICRPETYKQWQIRYRRAGFKFLPLNQDLMKELAGKVKEGYHKNFMFDGDGYWMHMGWKGKIIHSCSCWIPA